MPSGLTSLFGFKVNYSKVSCVRIFRNFTVMHDSAIILIAEKIDSLSSQTVVQVSCGAGHSLALTQAGEVFSWGDNHSNQLGRGQVDQDLWRTPK